MLKLASILFIIGILLIGSNSLSQHVERSDKGSISITICPSTACQEAYSTIQKTAVCALYDYKGFTPPKESIIDAKHYKGVGINGSKYATNHNKYCATTTTIITGSHNPTKTKNRDLVIIINSTILARQYRTAYNALKHSRAPPRFPPVNISGTLIEALMCPSQPCKQRVLEELNKAKENIRYLAYSFTDHDVATAIIKKNISVEGILDTGTFTGDQRPTLSKRPLYEYTGKGLLHHKLFIIYNETIITGSANPTTNGYTRNDENIVIITSTTLARQLLNEYAYIKTQSRKLNEDDEKIRSLEKKGSPS